MMSSNSTKEKVRAVKILNKNAVSGWLTAFLLCMIFI